VLDTVSLAITAYPLIPATRGMALNSWMGSISTAVPGMFWLFSASLFDDHFRLRPWQIALVSLTAAYNFTEGLERNSCTCVVDNKDEGRSSDFYGLTKVDGTLIISNPSATGDLTEPPFNDCPDGDDMEQLNARVTYYSPDRNWELAAFVTNATDWEPDDVDAGGLGGELASNFSDGSPSYGRTQEPRMYGMEFRYNFN
jgi:hypothetical protein